MLDRFIQFIQEEKLIQPEEKILLAASAGVDSTVLCHLFQQAGLDFAVAHCNFQLRGEEAEADEKFTRKLAAQLGVPFFSTRFDTLDYAQINRLSIQAAARELRYEWLEKTRQDAGYQFIATAHHLDDSIETALYNFAKGCGIRGLHGIAARRERLIRPLLFATKAEILHFAGMENIAFREDSSNLSVKYARNLIRHSVMPAFQKINPAFQQSAGETLAHLRDAEALYDFALAVIRENVLTIQGDEHRIEIAKLLSYPASATVLFELLKPLNFNSDQVAQILQSLENQPGKLFYSPTHKLLLDRSFLVAKLGGDVGGGVKIDAISPYPISVPGGRLSLQIQTKLPFPLPTANSQLPTANWSVCLDFNEMTFPLTLRHWHPGDVFCPLGMDGKHKKLQDLFTDRKLSRFAKEQVWLLESDGKICWVVGMALDERFKVLPETKTYLVATFEQDTFANK